MVFGIINMKNIKCLLNGVKLLFRYPKIFLGLLFLKENLKVKIRASCSIYQATKRGWIPQQLVKNEKLVLFKHKNLGIVVFQPLINVLGEDLLSWISHVPNCEVFLDVGAFAGETSILVAVLKHCKTVVAIEPANFLWPVMNRNIALNNLEDTIVLVPAAVGDKDKNEEVIHSSYPPGTPGFGLIHGTKKSYILSVETLSFPSLIRKYSPDVIKVDCEGCEKYLVDVPCNLLTITSVWIVETHSPAIEEKIVERFFTCGFTLAKWWKTSKNTTLLLFEKVIKSEG